jgi:putative acetyltransferase
MIAIPSPVLAVRLEGEADTLQVRVVLVSAFGGCAEADLVERLRTGGKVVLALVAERADGSIIGYVAFPRLWIECPGAELAAVGLAPLAVAPDMQRQGVGSALVQRAIALLAQRGEQLVFVVGSPSYYARFGFAAAGASRFGSPYRGEHFMVLRLTQAAPWQGCVRYPSAFAELG